MLGTAVIDADKAREILQKARTDAAVAARSYEDAIAGVPEQFRGEGALDQEGRTIAGSIRTLRDALAVAEERLRTNATTKDTAATRFAGAVEAVALTDAEAKMAQRAFEARLAEVGLDLAANGLGCVDIPVMSTNAERMRASEDVVFDANEERRVRTNIPTCDHNDPTVRRSGRPLRFLNILGPSMSLSRGRQVHPSRGASWITSKRTAVVIPPPDA